MIDSDPRIVLRIQLMNKTGTLIYQHSGNNSLAGDINSMIINVNGNGRHNSKVLLYYDMYSVCT